MDSYQKRVLEELGLPVLVMRPLQQPGRGDEPVSATAVRNDASNAAAAPTFEPAQRPADAASRLVRDLLRAAALPPAGQERLFALTGDLQALHGSPAAKRALWPLLRRLRRQADA